MRITVVGDCLLDVDVVGAAERLSPEAPVPVIDVHTTTYRAGGAGLVASMLSRDGHDVELVTALAADAGAERLRACLAGVRVISGASDATAVKTRVRAGGQSLLRIDESCGEASLPSVTDDMITAIESADVLIVADYGRGLTAHPRLRSALQGRGQSVPLVWDPHPKGAQPVESTTAVTPNLNEATHAAGLKGSTIPSAARAAEILGDRWCCAAVVVTLGPQGALVHQTSDGDAPLLVPTKEILSQDTCGAGDRFSATVAVQLARGAELVDAVRAAVAEVTIFLTSGGVASLDNPRAPRVLSTAPDALTVVGDVRRLHGTVVATGGCFDLLHAGHSRTLSAARALGDCLIVCLNSDESVRRLKGAGRPIVSEQDRIDLLMALECVDGVVVFDEDTPEEAIRGLQPDLWVKGGDYAASDLPEAALLEEWGGQAITVPFYSGRSTTTLVAALSNAR